MALRLYEVQLSHDSGKGWRPTSRRFVFTTDPVRAMALATRGTTDPVVHQVILRSGDAGVILDGDVCRVVDPPVVVGISPE